MENKNWWESQTIISIAVMILASMFRTLKWDINESEITNLVTLLITLIAAIFAIVGRIKATKKLV